MQLCNEMRESWTLCLVGVMISEISGRFWSQSKQRYLCLEQNRQILRFDMFGNAPDTKPSSEVCTDRSKNSVRARKPDICLPVCQISWHMGTYIYFNRRRFFLEAGSFTAVWGRSDTAGLQQHEADAEVIQTPVRNCKVISSNMIR